MTIPNDIIYLISEYNNGVIDSINLSLMNKEIYNNSNRIFLNDPFVTYNNYVNVLKYNFNNFRFQENLSSLIRDYNKFYQKVNKCLIQKIEDFDIISKNTKEIIVNLNEEIKILNFGQFNVSSIIINCLNGENICQQIFFPENLTHLTLGDNFNQSINLPNNLTHLTLGYSFNQSINLPNSLTHLTLGNDFNQPITLTNNLTHLTFGNKFNQSINLPNSLIRLTFGFEFNQLLTLPNNLTHLNLGFCFDRPIIFPDNLTHLTFGFWFNQPINLPNSLTHLTFGYCFNQPIILPNSLTHLTFGYNFNQSINLIDENTGKTFENLKIIKLSEKFNNKLEIGEINGFDKIKIMLGDMKYITKIFTVEQRRYLKNYIITDSNNTKVDFILSSD